MLNPKINKMVVINPTSEESKGLKLLDPGELFEQLVLKISSGPNREFRPMITQDKHIRLFISNVKPSSRSIQSFSGKALNNMEEALAYFASVGNELYGPGWRVELMKHEIQLGRDNSYGITVPDQRLFMQLAKEFDDFVQYRVSTPFPLDTESTPKTQALPRAKNKLKTQDETQAENKTENKEGKTDE